ncbi:MAG: hypothetical protein LC777_00770 [Actinobacteria bacterium]|nr:hypothetical protein [Actinomycetota bacterium]
MSMTYSERMQRSPRVDHRDDAWRALEAARWDAARAAFQTVLAQEPGSDGVLRRMGQRRVAGAL